MNNAFFPLMAVLIGASGVFSAADGDWGSATASLSTMFCLAGWYTAEQRRLRLEAQLNQITANLGAVNKEIDRG